MFVSGLVRNDGKHLRILCTHLAISSWLYILGTEVFILRFSPQQENESTPVERKAGYLNGFKYPNMGPIQRF